MTRPGFGPGVQFIEHPIYGGVAWPKFNEMNKHSIAYYFHHIRDLFAATKLVTNTRTVIQAGGSVGLWAKELAQVFGTVYTFEPHPDLFQCLVRNVPERNVIKQQAVLGASPGTASLRFENFGSHCVTFAEPGMYPKVRIDDLKLRDVDLIILDIEGYEYFTLKGAEETIQACRPVVMLEFTGHHRKFLVPDGAINAFLVSNGYEFHSAIGDDVIYVHKEHKG